MGFSTIAAGLLDSVASATERDAFWFGLLFGTFYFAWIIVGSVTLFEQHKSSDCNGPLYIFGVILLVIHACGWLFLIGAMICLAFCLICDN